MEASHDFSPPTKTNAINQKQKLTRIFLQYGVLSAASAILLFYSGTFVFQKGSVPSAFSARLALYSPVPLLTQNLANSGHSTTVQNGCICPTEMNMLYVGVPNPINVAIPGIPDSRVNVRIEGCDGEIEKRDDHYSVMVRTTGTATVSATYLSGGIPREYRMEFRVRQLPKPEVRYGNLNSFGLPIPRNAVAMQNRINVSMGNSFVFEGVRFAVTRYQFIFVPRKGETRAQMVSGNIIPASIQGIISSGSSGDRIIIDNIRCTGPTGERPLNPIMIELQ